MFIWILTLSSNLYYSRGTWSFRHFIHSLLSIMETHNYLRESQADETLHTLLLISLRSCYIPPFILSFTSQLCLAMFSFSLYLYLSFTAYPRILLSLFTNHSLCPQEVSLIHYLSWVFSLIFPSLYFSHYCSTTSWKTLLVSSKTTLVVWDGKIHKIWVLDEDFSSLSTLQKINKEKILWVLRIDCLFLKMVVFAVLNLKVCCLITNQVQYCQA